ncbi:MAG: protein phosphatase 2C domain-containing protein [Lachnospiraceae bacterium]|nr:protein phosphatase 2C domain-containing protein [Lachnospiraceae bacterium]
MEDLKEKPLPVGGILKNRYRIISVLGMGGFGITYRAEDRLLNCYVAVKGSSLGFKREAALLEAVRDVPYIARLRDYFEEAGTEYIVLNLIEGKTLLEYAKECGGTLPAAEALSLLRNTFDTLLKLHDIGYIHRDISPGNLMLSEDNRVYLIDFGAAASFGENNKSDDKPIFRHKGLEAPEHSQPDLQGPWTDIFSLCATIVYLITGEGIAEARDRQLFDRLPRLLTRSALSSRQQNALIKGLNPDISRRFADAGQIYEELYGEELTAGETAEEWRVFYHARTYIGSRQLNQDNFAVDSLFYYKGEDCEQSGVLSCRPKEIHVAVVCDGVGGSNHGELAAKAAVQAVIHFAEAHPEGDALPDRLLEELLDQINEKILQLGEKIGRTATTLSLLMWRGDRCYAVNIGDSPIYFLRGGRLKRISTPHTRAELNIMQQKPLQLRDCNTLMKYLGKSGVTGSQMADFYYGRLMKGDTLLICSDGVSKKLEESRLKRYLAKKEGKSIPAIFKAIEKSEHNDNCTAIVLKF